MHRLPECYNDICGELQQETLIPNEDGILEKEIHCSLRHPFDVTCLDDTTVTVSTYNGIEVTMEPSHATL